MWHTHAVAQQVDALVEVGLSELSQFCFSLCIDEQNLGVAVVGDVAETAVTAAVACGIAVVDHRFPLAHRVSLVGIQHLPEWSSWSCRTAVAWIDYLQLQTGIAVLEAFGKGFCVVALDGSVGYGTAVVG